MKATISSLRDLGFAIELDGDIVSWRWKGTGSPDPDTLKPLLEELKAKKSAVLEILRQEETDRSDVHHIHSRILDAEVWIVPDGWTGELVGPVYADAEIRELNRQAVTAEELSLIHSAKVELDGKVMRLSETDQLQQNIDPFDRGNYPGDGTVVVLTDLDQEGCFTAHRVGSWPPEAIGHGDTVLEAVDELLALEDLESTEPR